MKLEILEIALLILVLALDCLDLDLDFFHFSLSIAFTRVGVYSFITDLTSLDWDFRLLCNLHLDFEIPSYLELNFLAASGWSMKDLVLESAYGLNWVLLSSTFSGKSKLVVSCFSSYLWECYLSSEVRSEKSTFLFNFRSCRVMSSKTTGESLEVFLSLDLRHIDFS